jgi:hypothetical protein
MKDDCNTNLSFDNAKTEENSSREFSPPYISARSHHHKWLVSQQPMRVMDRRGPNASMRFSTTIPIQSFKLIELK